MFVPMTHNDSLNLFNGIGRLSISLMLLLWFLQCMKKHAYIQGDMHNERK